MRAGPLVLLLLASPLAFGEEPEPGPIPLRAVKVRELVLPAHEGDARAALKLFLDAHAAHKRGDADAALAGYLKFLGMPSRAKLPPRYAATVAKRVAALRAAARKAYDAARKLYERDRAKGVPALEKIAARYVLLPEGAAARRLWQSDAMHTALEKARAQKDKALLEKAIRTLPDAIQTYEAKSTLIELGGPDLFAPGEKIGGGKALPEPDDDDDDDGRGGDTTIEEGDD